MQRLMLYIGGHQNKGEYWYMTYVNDLELRREKPDMEIALKIQK